VEISKKMNENNIDKDIQDFKYILQTERAVITAAIEDYKQHMNTKFAAQDVVLDTLKTSHQNLFAAIKEQDAIIKLNNARMLVIEGAAYKTKLVFD
jgi:hypothetical protein